MEYIIQVLSHVDREGTRWWTSSIEFKNREGRDQLVRSDLWIGRSPQSAAGYAVRWIDEAELEQSIKEAREKNEKAKV